MRSLDHPFETLNEMLRRRAEQKPHACAYTFLGDDAEGGAERHSSFAELDLHARAIASALQEHSVNQDRVLLLYAPGLEYIEAFFGCLYAGAIAVPAYPPHHPQALSRIMAILQDARPRFALTTSSILETVKGFETEYPALRSIQWIATDTLPVGLEAGWTPPRVTGDNLAFLQYTSGSTATPKGVMVLHRNLIANEEMIRKRFGHDEQTTMVSWLPLYHDMGLIGNVLQPLYVGGRSILMSPWAFLQRPGRWLSAISKYRATSSGGPNFAYALCARRVKPEQRAALDLSSWRVAFNGAEPIRAETLELFTRTFAPAGFRREAFYPCYGLAEATLFVSGGIASEPYRTLTLEADALKRNQVLVAADDSRETRTMVGCGLNEEEALIRIVEPETRRACAPGEIGEVWVAGPHVTQGYWNRAELSAETFHAQIVGEEGTRFLRTGDLGFLHESELYITGRIKDLIIVDGRNHYPQDIEHTVESLHEAFRTGCSVAFSVEHESQEKLVVMVEVGHHYQPPGSGNAAPLFDPQEVARKIRRAVATTHSLDVHNVVLLRQGEVLKTSSGKVQRQACRAKYLDASLLPWSAE